MSACDLKTQANASGDAAPAPVPALDQNAVNELRDRIMRLEFQTGSLRRRLDSADEVFLSYPFGEHRR
jgi:hypothetical protein